MTQPHPQPVDYLECARMDIRVNSYISGDKMVVDMDDVDDVISTLKAERTHTPAAPAERLCDDCNILDVEERVMELEQELKDARKAVREETIREMLNRFKFSRPGREITPICDMCGANPYCIELRGGA